MKLIMYSLIPYAQLTNTYAMHYEMLECIIYYLIEVVHKMILK